jgi:anti-sigma factor RsiW
MTLPRASEINRDTNGPLWVQAHITELRAEVDGILSGATKAEFAALLADLREAAANCKKMRDERAASQDGITSRLANLERQIEKLSQKDSQ